MVTRGSHLLYGARSWAGIEYDGRWKVLHYMQRDIYQPVFISPFWNYTTGDPEVYVTSDPWETVYGTATLNWHSYNGMPIAHNAGTPPSTTFQVGAINTTFVYSSNIHQLSVPDLKDADLVLSVEASRHRPNEPIRTSATTFTHENFFSPVWMNAAKLVDPGLKVTYDSSTQKFTVETTKGASLYTWLDYPAGLVGYFDENNFVLLSGQEEVGFTIQHSPGSAAWVKGVTVQSMWDQMQKEY
jgi:beta-mannosidase